MNVYFQIVPCGKNDHAGMNKQKKTVHAYWKIKKVKKELYIRTSLKRFIYAFYTNEFF